MSASNSPNGGVVAQFIAALFPRGTNVDPGTYEINLPPGWPPDLFAVTSALLMRCGGYWSLTADRAARDALDTLRLQELIWKYGLFGIKTSACSFTRGQRAFLNKCWLTLLNDKAQCFSDVSPATVRAALTLMLIADGASVGAGRVTNEWPIASLIFEEHTKLLTGGMASLPRSLCHMVPEDQIRVLPKVLSPDTGQTVRSLSRHLCVINHSEVVPKWCFGATSEEIKYSTPTTLNMLVVPFPYRIDTQCFHPSPDSPRRIHDNQRFCFALDQRWLKNLAGGKKLSGLISALISQAERNGSPINAVILPELAISYDAAEPLAETVARKHKSVRLFVTGVGRGLGKSGGPPRNGCWSFVFKEGQPVNKWYQSKHHQWRLDRDQITQYGLNAALDQRKEWWEDFKVERECVFCSVDGGLVFTTLICEDIARIEPVLPVLRAVGPNLVIALLMDDSQLDVRWGAKSSAAITEDPGSSVLTVTSLGLIRRSRFTLASDNPTPPIIAHWQGRVGGGRKPIGRQIEMEHGAHGVVIAITCNEDYTPNASFVKSTPVKLASPPDWVNTLFA